MMLNGIAEALEKSLPVLDDITNVTCEPERYHD